MLLESVQIKGFRNFVDTVVHLDKSTLIVGGNDTGKTNLLYAIRILLDPTLSSKELELTESDFHVGDACEKIEIIVKLVEVTEKCLISAFGGSRSDDGIVYIAYSTTRDGDYRFATGYPVTESGGDNSGDDVFPNFEDLDKCTSRYYLRQLSMEYVGSSRDLSGFLKRQQRTLLELARGSRTDVEEAEDANSIQGIQTSLENLNADISDLHYIADSLKAVNNEMGNLSANNTGYEARLVAGNTDANKLVDNLRLAYLYKNAPLTFGGDGRSNQLYFVTWMAERKISPTSAQEKVVLFAVEEPEVHLHPHQQRRLAQYISSGLDEQMLMTTHSPQIISNFYDGRILRLSALPGQSGTVAHGCEATVDAALERFGYRLNPITAELFFCSGAFLVEGVSEKIFYTALSRSLGIDFDRQNLSIISVEGVGFKKYVQVCTALGIPFALRTDNDIFSIPKTSRYRYAGIQRAVDLLDVLPISPERNDAITQSRANASLLEWDGMNPEQANIDAGKRIIEKLKSCGIYLADRDLETDLANSAISNQLQSHYGISDITKLIAKMQQRKAENMHGFISEANGLDQLANSALAEPLYAFIAQASGGQDVEDAN